jgi:hypothetical protein
MATLTRAQREALKRIYDRCPSLPTNDAPRANAPLAYTQFRRSVRVGYDCIMLPWRGMWLGIERDGYTHS